MQGIAAAKKLLLNSGLKILIFFISIHLKAQTYGFREFAEEISQPYVYSILQDNRGYLWIGTGNGLTRYDGVSFKSFTTRDSLADNFISCSLKIKNKLWFGHLNGKFTFFDGRNFSPLKIKLPTGITDLEKNYSNEVWSSSFSNGFVRLDKLSDNSKVLQDQVPVFCFKFLKRRDLLVGTINGLLYCILPNSGELQVKKKIENFPEVKVSDIIEIRNGSGYYVATENDGIYKVLPDKNGFKVELLKTGLYSELTRIQGIYEDSKFNLWVSTFGNGLIRLGFSSLGEYIGYSVFNKSHGFSSDYIKSTLEDRDGNIWCGKYGSGLTQITEKAFSILSLADNEVKSLVTASLVDNNFLWAGSERRLIKQDLKTGKIIKIYTKGLPSDKITSIFNLNGELWIGTDQNGIFRLQADKEKFVGYEISDGALENSINSITGRYNHLWVSTKKGACDIELPSGRINWYTHSQGLPHNYVTNIFIDSKNRIWISTLSNILTIIDRGRMEKKILLSDKRILALGAIVEEKENTFWVASNGSGLFKISNDSVLNVTSNDGLFSDYCYSLVLDNYRNLLTGHRGGITKVRTYDLFAKIYTKDIGIQNDYEFLQNGACSYHNKIYLGFNKGILSYDPLLDNTGLLPPLLNITSVKVNDEEKEYHQRLTLTPGKYKLKIEYLGISLKEPGLVRYKYQLIGYDIEPETTSATSVIYPRLSEGEYDFKLWGISGDGVITKSPLTIKLIIKTPVWKQWWFYILIILLLQVSVILYNRKKELKLLNEKADLEDKVLQRTIELNQKNTLLEENKKELERYQNFLEDLVQERTLELLKAKNMAEESDKLKTAILNNLNHEIRTPMNAISGFSSLLNDKNLTKKEREEYVKIINHNSTSLLTMINDLVELSLMEVNQIKLQKDNIAVNEFLSELEHAFKETSPNIELINMNKNYTEETFVICDRKKLLFIFNNLLNNAFKYTISGSITYGYEKFEKYVRFFVSDTGIGIGESDAKKIFDLFYKVDGHSKTLYRGAGIGLTTNKKLVELMGGEIWVESEINKGSTFYFTLPLEVDYT